MRVCPIVAIVWVITAVPVNTAVSTNEYLLIITDSAVIPKVSTVLNSRLERLCRSKVEKNLEIFGI